MTEEEITRRAVARTTLEEWQAWMQKGGEDLPVTTFLGQQDELRAAQLRKGHATQLLAAEDMGLGAQDVGLDCCIGDSGELSDTHALRELLNTTDSWATTS